MNLIADILLIAGALGAAARGARRVAGLASCNNSMETVSQGFSGNGY